MKTHSLSILKNTVLAAAVAMLAACASNHANKSVPEGYYRVQQGDTLYRIARRYHQNVGTLAAWNNLTNSSKIEVGQVLRVRSVTGSRVASSRRVNTQTARMVAPVNRIDLQWPVDNGRNSIVQRYNGSSSKGIDISGQRGQTVRAAASGKVIYVGDGVRGYGKLILISHNASTITAYAHNDNILVSENQMVNAGQVIANMGSTDADSVKLHFELRMGGKAVDPMLYLK